MSKSAMIEEESSWAQTFVTVTPQDDGFLREIENTSIVSGNSDVPLNLDTWNIVLRRSLRDTTNDDFVNPREFEKSQRTTAQCQTYLQGVPRVELPLVYRDEATQTLYIGKDEPNTFERAFDDIITVMNDKPLPEWKKSQYVQTNRNWIRLMSGEYRVLDLEKAETTNRLAIVESSDILNFLIDRTLWMCEAVSLPKIVKKNANSQTVVHESMEYCMFDDETRTSRSFVQNDSKLMSWDQLVANSRVRVVPRSRIMKDDVVEDIVESSELEVCLQREKKIHKIEKKNDDEQIMPLILDNSPLIYTAPRRRPVSSSTMEKSRRTRKILLDDNSSRVVENQEAISEDSKTYLESTYSPRFPKVSKTSTRAVSRSNTVISSRRITEKVCSKTVENLTPRDEKALNVLKDTFCRGETETEEQSKSRWYETSSSRPRKIRDSRLESDDENRSTSPPRSSYYLGQ